MSSKTRPSQILSIARRSFASSLPKQSGDTKPAPPRNVSQQKPQQRNRRSAHTATAQVEEPDNFERHNQPPNEYGEYRLHPRTILRPDNLFHPFSKSPIPEIRQRAAFTRQHAYCPHPIHQQTREPISPTDPEARKTASDIAQPPAHVQFECPDCGIATYCCEEHWADDYEAHLEICDTLQQINEDDHDLRSGRWFPEFEYPGPQLDEILVNLMSWDTFLYTRGFEAINEERSMRQATRLLTYPLTVGSVLHELSPYNIRSGGRLTSEGLKSLSGEFQRVQSLKTC
jgi:splicing suppressor protein 51